MSHVELEAAVRRAAGAMLRLSDSDRSCHRADRALTLHLLEHHAPRTFAALGLAGTLEDALAGLRRVPRRFPKGLAWHEVMARVDALYLLALRTRATPRFDRRGLAEAVGRLERRGLRGLAWLLAALCVPLGVELRVSAPETSHDVGAALYEATHDVLIASDFLARPVVLPRAALAVLREGIAWALDRRAWDLLGELVFCLRAGGEAVDDAVVAALLAAQHAGGHFEERGCRTPRERVHTTASCLVALAGELDRQR